ncbi:Rtf2 RING-finger domain containing protein [Naviculisporaceae sp. PSN 640]
MGNDGGSIPTRRELVKSAARAPTVSELKATALESLDHAWKHDPLTSDRLDMDNVVADWQGRLYNYESILNALIPAETKENPEDDSTPPSLSNSESAGLSFASTGIKSLRDVVKLKFKRYSPQGSKGREIIACPVSLKELGGSVKAVYLVPCGHVFAEVAIRQIQEEEMACPECSEPFKAEDSIPVLPTDKEEIQKLAARLESLKEKGLTHSLKKDKSAGKKKRKADAVKEDDKAEKPAKKREKDSRLSGINNPMTASITAKVLAEQDEQNKRRKLAAAR